MYFTLSSFWHARLSSALAVCCAGTGLSARAIEINFEPPAYSVKGGQYANGSLIGQGDGARWIADADFNKDVFRIVSDGAGGQMLKAFDTAIKAHGPVYGFSPVSAGLDFSKASSVLRFAFRYKLHAGPATSGSSATMRFYIGEAWESSAVGIVFRHDGKIFVTNGDGAGNGTYANVVKDAGGLDLVVGKDESVSLTGEIDYAAKTWSLSVNKIPQQAAGNPAFGFRGKDSDASIGLRDMSAGTPDFRAYSLDDIRLESVKK